MENEKHLNLAKSMIEEGNEAFKSGDLLWAKQCYSNAIKANCTEILVSLFLADLPCFDHLKLTFYF